MAKYGNSKVNIDGISFDSKDEARYYEYLKKQREEPVSNLYTLNSSETPNSWREIL